MVISLNQILNVQPNLQIAIYLKDRRAYLTFFSMMLKSMSFPLIVPNRTSYGRIDFSLQSPEFYSHIQLEIEKETVFTTMCPKEQQTSDNLIVKDNCLSLKYLINAALVVSVGDV